MQFHMFHLMPWPHLPDDFDRRESAWVTLPNSCYDPEIGHHLYNRYLDELEYAEQLGFDGVCVNEHHQNAYGTMPSPNIMAATLARRTSRVQIVILGNAIPLRDHPLRVAEEVAMLDVLSGGRIVSGFPRGLGDEYFSYSLDPSRSRERFREAHDLIVKAWTTEGPFRWTSPNYRFRYVNVWPRPYQKPHPPIWIPAFGSAETMEFCAEHHYTYFAVYAPSTVVKRWFEGLREAAGALGYEPPPEQIGMLLPIYVAETDEQAHDEGAQHVSWLYHKGLKHKWEHIFPPGYMGGESMRGLLRSGLKPFHQVSYEELVEQGYAIVGSPETVRARLEELEQELGFGVLLALLQIGDMPHHRTVKNMELFATEVMPYFRAKEDARKAPALAAAAAAS